MPPVSIPPAARTDIDTLKREARAKPARSDFPTRATEALHPALIATARTLRAAKPDRDGFIHARGEKDLCGLFLSIEHSERIIAFLDALFRELSARGIDISTNGTRMIARRNRDDVEFRIAGKTAQRLYRPTEAERAQDKERERRVALGFRSDEKRAYPDTHVVFNGRYALFIETWTPGVRKSWRDTHNQSLESLFHDIAAGIEACLIAQAARREEREQRWKREQDEAAARARAEKRLAREQQRASFLANLLALEAEAIRLEAWLARALPADAASEPWPSFRAWAQARLERIRIQSEPEQVNASLASQSDLFPDPDPLAEPAGIGHFDHDDEYENQDDDFDE